jgi:hypothetical protein
VVLDFELWALCLLGRCSTTLAISPALFAFIIFQIRAHIYAQASLNCGVRGAVLLVEVGVLRIFCPDWSQIMIFLINISQVAEIS